VRRRLLLLAAACAASGALPAYGQRTELKTDLIVQQTPSWCWAAAASMALNMLGFPDINPAKNYQCGVVAAAFPNCDDDCTKCETTLDNMAKFVGVLDRYRDLAQRGHPTALQAAFKPNFTLYPSFVRIKRSLDHSYPVIAGVSFDGAPADPAVPEHALLITGYEENYLGTGEVWMIVRDPFPYEAGADPYSMFGYPYRRSTGKATVPWRTLRDRMNLTSAVFLEKLSA
jgi:hypothetical protein